MAVGFVTELSSGFRPGRTDKGEAEVLQVFRVGHSHPLKATLVAAKFPSELLNDAIILVDMPRRAVVEAEEVTVARVATILAEAWTVTTPVSADDVACGALR